MNRTWKRWALPTLVPGMLLLIATAGCESPVEREGEIRADLVEATFTRGNPDGLLPVRGQATFSGDLFAPGQEGSADRCNELGLLTLAGSGEGVVTYVGRFTTSFSNCTDVPIPGPVDVLMGEVVLSSPNGDLLLLTYSGVQEEVDEATFAAPFSLTLPVAGGTGRFDGATGSLTLDGVFDFNPDAVSSGVWGGSIRFDASRRRP